MRNRKIGAFIGLAVGDALGTTLEFSKRDTLPLHTEMIGGGPFMLEPGVWTDDTSMALALAESLLERGGLNEVDLMSRFANWYVHGMYSPTGTCFDIGNTTRRAIERFIKTGNPRAALERRKIFAGNGCLMRLAPVAIYYANDPFAARTAAKNQAATTHSAPECIESSVFFADLLLDAFEGVERDELLDLDFWKALDRNDIKSTGYVLDSLEAAQWAVANSSSFEEALILAVNLGDDADTVGAITGQLAGAIYGVEAIPQRWIEPLAWRERLFDVAERLSQIEI